MASRNTLVVALVAITCGCVVGQGGVRRQRCDSRLANMFDGVCLSEEERGSQCVTLDERVITF